MQQAHLCFINSSSAKTLRNTKLTQSLLVSTMQTINALSLLLAAGLGISAAPAAGAVTSSLANDAALTEMQAPRFSCGQYKFSDGVVQEFYSLVWAGQPPNQKVCRYFKYEFHDKKGQEGTMVAAKVDFGCTCFFYV